VDEIGYDNRLEEAEKEVEEIKKFRENIIQKLKKLGLHSIQKEEYDDIMG
jgi:hypothetical protein